MLDVGTQQRYKQIMTKYPIYLDLKQQRAVVIGGGTIAFRKAQVLLEAGARVVVVAKKVSEAMEKLCLTTPTELIKGSYSKEYIGCARLVIAATNDQELNETIYEDCQALEILCNVVDQPDLCDFYVPAVVKRGCLQIAIGTDGYCPAYAGHLRRKIEQLITEKHGQFVCQLEWARKEVLRASDDPDQKKAILGDLVSDHSFDIFCQEGTEPWRDYAREHIQQCISGDL